MEAFLGKKIDVTLDLGFIHSVLFAKKEGNVTA
jgi:hypothetical protein